jgi:NAD(P)-dependent dehydrogenase (short-subunit alcohol dehydrogenase family)
LPSKKTTSRTASTSCPSRGETRQSETQRNRIGAVSSELAGKAAIVTGGASGIGRGIVERFLAEGARVVIADIDRDAGEAQAADYGADARFTQTDVAAPEQVERLISFAVEGFGQLDVMVNNAGISGPLRVGFLDDDFGAFERIMAVNVRGVMVGTRSAAQYMATRNAGSIINVASIAGVQPSGGMVIYAASKAAVVMFTRCAAISLGAKNIRVNCIAPGHINTPILESAVSGLPEQQQAQALQAVRTTMLASQPLKRLGEPDDVARLALYLASDHSSYMTGAVLPVDGGTTAGSPPPPSAVLDKLGQRS